MGYVYYKGEMGDMTEFEKPLRGWKEICGFLGVSRNTARKILSSSRLLHKEGKSAVLLPSEYSRTLKNIDRK